MAKIANAQVLAVEPIGLGVLSDSNGLLVFAAAPGDVSWVFMELGAAVIGLAVLAPCRGGLIGRFESRWRSGGSWRVFHRHSGFGGERRAGATVGAIIGGLCPVVGHAGTSASSWNGALHGLRASKISHQVDGPWSLRAVRPFLPSKHS